MKACLNQPDAALQAQNNGSPVSPIDYLVARVRDAVYSGDNSRVATPDRKRIADNVGQQLNLLLQNILESIPDPNGTPSDVMMSWGSQLKQYDSPSCPVSSYFASTMDRCYSKAQAVVNRELADPRTELGAAKKALEASSASGSNAA